MDLKNNIVIHIASLQANNQVELARKVMMIDAIIDMLDTLLIDLENTLKVKGGLNKEYKQDLIIARNTIKRLVRNNDKYFTYEKAVNWGEACDEFMKQFKILFNQIVDIKDGPISVE